MSFSSEIKEELSRNIPRARHCQIAEIAAMLSFIGTVRETKTAFVGFYCRKVITAK